MDLSLSDYSDKPIKEEASGWSPFVRFGSACLSSFFIFPMKRAQIIYQTRAVSLTASSFSDNYIKALNDVLHEPGSVTGLWRGWASNVVELLPTEIFYLMQSNNDSSEDKVQEKSKRKWKSNLTSAAVDLIFLFLAFPFEVVSIQMATDIKIGGVRKFLNSKDALIKLYDHEGILGLYKGFSVFAIPKIFLNIVYTEIRKRNSKKSKELQWTEIILWKGLDITLGLILCACQNISRRLIFEMGNDTRKYQGIVDCAKKVLKEEGVLGFFRGVVEQSIIEYAENYFFDLFISLLTPKKKSKSN